MNKRCRKCGLEKPVDEFPKNYNKKNLPSRSDTGSYCRKCVAEKSADWRDRNPGAFKEYYQSKRDELLAKKRIYQREYSCKPEAKRSNFEAKNRRYGLEPEDFGWMLHGQLFKCAGCSDSLDFERPDWVCVDHCHDSGKVRGILCAPCNKALGYARDSAARLRGLVEYAVKHSSLKSVKLAR